MSPPAARSRLAALALCGLLGVTGCSDTDGGGGGDDGSSELEANARAAAINVSLGDLPEGYVAIPASDDEQAEPAPVEGCIGGIDDVTVAAAASPTFRLQEDASLHFVASETSILTSSEPGEERIASAQEEPVLDCLSERLGEVFANLLPQTTTQTELTLTPDPGFPDLGDNSVRLAGTATFTQEGTPAPIPVSTSLVLIQTDDALSVLLFGGVFEPFPAETMTSLATAVAERQ